MTVLFHLACFRVYPCYNTYQYFILFVWLTDTLVYEYITFCLSIYQLMNMWVVSTLTLMNNTLMNIHTHFCVWIYTFISRGYIPGSGISGSNGNTMFEILKNCQIIFQGGRTILYSYFCTAHGVTTCFGATHGSTHRATLPFLQG